MRKIQKPIPPHSNFMALFYIWSITALLLGGITGLIYLLIL
jgi:hypothetical protein